MRKAKKKVFIVARTLSNGYRRRLESPTRRERQAAEAGKDLLFCGVL
jgi:2-methylisocitrate lyase-like PEP mutase family enzyme